MGTKKACGPTEDKDTATFDSDVKNIDVEKIKKILDTRYNEKDVKRKSIAPLEEEEETL